MKIIGFLAEDQYGCLVKLPEPKHPRKQLLQKLGLQHTAKMYCDTKDGQSKHVGYVLGKRWFHLWTVSEWPPTTTT